MTPRHVVVGAAALFAATAAIGSLLHRAQPELKLRGAPFFARYGLIDDVWLLVPAAAFATAVVAFGPSLAARLRWWTLVAGSAAGSVVWAVALAASEGLHRLAEPLASRHEYLTEVPLTEPWNTYLDGFVAELPGAVTHVRGHPPGMVLVLDALHGMGLTGPGWAAALVIASWGVATAAVLVAVASVAGRPTARAVAPALVLAPAAVFAATSADAFFAAVVATGIALVAVAVTLPARSSRLAGAAGGAVLAAALFLSYGVVTSLLIPAALVVAARRWQVLAAAAVGATAVTAAFTLAGFWWFDGLATTRIEYTSGLGGIRPYGYFLFANLAVLAVLVGPAALAGAPLLRGAAWRLVGAALVAVAVADLSGLSKGEVERIWLLFAPWLVVAAAGLAPLPRRSARRWLAAQAGLALLVQLVVRSPW